MGKDEDEGKKGVGRAGKAARGRGRGEAMDKEESSCGG